jgi:pSer/pThr/pTyr-binding forkhead associated (FHA) protein
MYHGNSEFYQNKYLLIKLKEFKLILLENESYSIGRDPLSDIFLESEMISRVHANIVRIAAQDGTYYHYKLIDGRGSEIPSANGIFVNGHRVSEKILENGDRMSFGGVIDALFFSSNDLIEENRLESIFNDFSNQPCTSSLDQEGVSGVMLGENDMTSIFF